MIGSGIFYLGSYVLERTQMSMGLALVCWIVGGLVSILGGLCFAELGACDSRAGGMVVYMNRAYHPSVGYSFGFTSWVISGSGSIAALAIALPTALAEFLNLNDMAIKIVAIVLIIGLTAYNCFGIKLGSILQNVSMVAKLIPIVLIIGAGLILGKESPDLSLVPEGTDPTFGGMIGMIGDWKKDPPIYERYFLGGGDSLRGFEYRTVSPTYNRENIGGQTMLLLTAEVSHPIYGPIRGAAFVDAGNAWRNSYSMGFSQMNVGAGYGLRIKVPILNAPIRLDLAYPVVNNQEAESNKVRFHFNLGFTF